MELNEGIEHLDSNEVTPFDAIVEVDQAITTARLAYQVLLRNLTYDAVRDDAEQWFNDGMAHLWSARESFKECVEANDA